MKQILSLLALIICVGLLSTAGLAAETLLIPFRTDKESYMDFFDEEGNVCRFAIEDLTDEMNLTRFGTPEELPGPAHGL